MLPTEGLFPLLMLLLLPLFVASVALDHAGELRHSADPARSAESGQ
jgi:hypothetical protein